MHILIVDDEYYIVQGIIEGIEWDALGIDKISSAFSMSQAQEVFRSQTVDLLLTDIEMPQGDGLDLIRWAARKRIFSPFNYPYRASAVRLCTGSGQSALLRIYPKARFPAQADSGASKCRFPARKASKRAACGILRFSDIRAKIYRAESPFSRTEPHADCKHLFYESGISFLPFPQKIWSIPELIHTGGTARTRSKAACHLPYVLTGDQLVRWLFFYAVLSQAIQERNRHDATAIPAVHRRRAFERDLGQDPFPTQASVCATASNDTFDSRHTKARRQMLRVYKAVSKKHAETGIAGQKREYRSKGSYSFSVCAVKTAIGTLVFLKIFCKMKAS